MMVMQLPTIYDMVAAMVLGVWLGIGGVKVLGGVGHFLRALAHRVSNRGKVWDLEIERNELLAAIERLETRGSRTRKRRNGR